MPTERSPLAPLLRGTKGECAVDICTLSGEPRIVWLPGAVGASYHRDDELDDRAASSVLLRECFAALEFDYDDFVRLATGVRGQMHFGVPAQHLARCAPCVHCLASR